MNPEISKRLTMLQVGGCSCGTKTPNIEFHDERCTYRLATEIEELLRESQGKLVGYTNARGTSFMAASVRTIMIHNKRLGGEFEIAGRNAEERFIFPLYADLP